MVQCGLIVCVPLSVLCFILSQSVVSQPTVSRRVELWCTFCGVFFFSMQTSRDVAVCFRVDVLNTDSPHYCSYD